MSVASYNNGIITRNKILEVSKNLFYEKGFNKTRIAEICDIADIKSGTFTYYFSTKRDIVNAIYGELLMQCYSFLRVNVKKPLKHIEKIVFATFLYYLAIFRNSNTVRYHHEVGLKESVYEYISKHVIKMYQSINSELHLNLGYEAINDVLLADAGARHEITQHLINQKGYNITDKDVLIFATKVHVFMGRLFTVDGEVMNLYIADAKEFVLSHDHSSIKFLI